MKYPILFWDIDGTLMDFKASEKVSLGNCLTRMGVVPEERLITGYSAINRKYWQAYERDEMTRDEVLIERFVEFFHTFGIKGDPKPFLTQYEEQLGHNWFIQDDALTLCKKLKDMGICQYAVTNGQADVQHTKLRESGLDQILDDCFISDDMGSWKPQKAFFEACFERVFGEKCPEPEKKAKVLMIGDSLTSDIRGGNNAGIDTCWYDDGSDPERVDVHVDYRISNLWDVLTL